MKKIQFSLDVDVASALCFRELHRMQSKHQLQEKYCAPFDTYLVFLREIYFGGIKDVNATKECPGAINAGKCAFTVCFVVVMCVILLIAYSVVERRWKFR